MTALDVIGRYDHDDEDGWRCSLVIPETRYSGPEGCDADATQLDPATGLWYCDRHSPTDRPMTIAQHEDPRDRPGG